MNEEDQEDVCAREDAVVPYKCDQDPGWEVSKGDAEMPGAAMSTDRSALQI